MSVTLFGTKNFCNDGQASKADWPMLFSSEPSANVTVSRLGAMKKHQPPMVVTVLGTLTCLMFATFSLKGSWFCVRTKCW